VWLGQFKKYEYCHLGRSSLPNGKLNPKKPRLVVRKTPRVSCRSASEGPSLILAAGGIADGRTPVWNQTGRLFLPLNFMVGWKPTERTVISAEFGIPIIKDFPVYTFKTQLRVGYLF
jgi:hypothetical protein